MSEIVAEPPSPPVIAGFLYLELMKINNLILIRFSSREHCATASSDNPHGRPRRP
jgi:hypothetical protein